MSRHFVREIQIDKITQILLFNRNVKTWSGSKVKVACLKGTNITASQLHEFIIHGRIPAQVQENAAAANVDHMEEEKKEK